MAQKQEPFVKGEDRPEIKLDTPLGELKVRDLLEILGVNQKVSDKSVTGEVLTKPTMKDYIEKNHLKDNLEKANKDWAERIFYAKQPGPEGNFIDPRDYIINWKELSTLIITQFADLKNSMADALEKKLG